MEKNNACSNDREKLGLRFTIDYLLYNKDQRLEKEELSSSTTIDPQITSGEQVNEALAEEKEKTPVSPNKSGEENGQSTNEKDKGTPSRENQEEKPSESYIALISMAILASEEKKLLLSDIYQWIMDHYPYFKSKDKHWRNSVRHNLSLNECFIKAGRSENGKGHFWAIHPANFHDFSKGDYHRRQARRRTRRVPGRLACNLPSLYQPSSYQSTLYQPSSYKPSFYQLSPYQPSLYQPFSHMKRTPCWCCPRPTQPRPSFSA